MPAAAEIDSEDETWQGQIDLRVFQQVRDQQEKARIIAKLEAQNRPTDGGPKESTLKRTEAAESSKEGSRTTEMLKRCEKKGCAVGAQSCDMGWQWAPSTTWATLFAVVCMLSTILFRLYTYYCQTTDSAQHVA